MSRVIYLSENEIVSYLKKTSLPTILVEGRDELSVYTRYLESKIDIEDVDVLPCQGRITLLNIFDRREEFKHKFLLMSSVSFLQAIALKVLSDK